MNAAVSGSDVEMASAGCASPLVGLGGFSEAIAIVSGFGRGDVSLYAEKCVSLWRIVRGGHGQSKWLALLGAEHDYGED